MSDARSLLWQYIRQRDELAEGPLVLSRESSEIVARLADRPVSTQPAEPLSGRGRAPKPGSLGSEKWKKGAPEIPVQGIVVTAPTTDLFDSDDAERADLDGIAAAVNECTNCRLCENRTNTVPGEGPSDARLVVVGEGPGAREDETGRPFVGRAGELLTEILRAIDLPREQVFICNIVKCRPPDNRKPQQDEIDACLKYLHRQLEIIGPKVILAMGGTAAETLLSVRQSLGSLRNRVHSFRGTKLVVTYHPAALLRNPNWKQPTWDDVRIARQLLEQ